MADLMRIFNRCLIALHNIMIGRWAVNYLCWIVEEQLCAMGYIKHVRFLTGATTSADAKHLPTCQKMTFLDTKNHQLLPSISRALELSLSRHTRNFS